MESSVTNVNGQVDSKPVRGVTSLFFIQIFSTLGYAVLYSTLVLYTTHRLGFSELEANAIMGVFAAFNYGLHLLGGCLGGRYLSNRCLLLVAMFLQIIACLLIASANLNAMYWGLAMFLAGCGMNVTCINMMLTQRFKPEDHRRETAFFWNYAGMNIGFFVGFGVAGFFELSQNYSSLFMFAMVGNIIAIVLLLISWRHVADLNTTLMHKKGKSFYLQMLLGGFCIVILIPILRVLLSYTNISSYFIIFVACVVFLSIIVLIIRHNNREEKRKMGAYLILTLGSLVFWSLYQLAPMGLTLFTENNVDRHVYGLLITPEWVQNINTVVIVIGGPLMAAIFAKMRKAGVNVNIPTQFAISLFCIGLGMFALVWGIDFAGDQLVAFKWIVISYILQSIGELMISPIGYAMIGRLAPVRYQGFMMGSWMFVSGLAAVIASYLSRSMPQHSGHLSMLESNASYHSIFSQLGWGAVITAVILAILIPFLRRLIVNQSDNNQVKSVEVDA